MQLISFSFFSYLSLQNFIICVIANNLLFSSFYFFTPSSFFSKAWARLSLYQPQAPYPFPVAHPLPSSSFCKASLFSSILLYLCEKLKAKRCWLMDWLYFVIIGLSMLIRCCRLCVPCGWTCTYRGLWCITPSLLPYGRRGTAYGGG